MGNLGRTQATKSSLNCIKISLPLLLNSHQNVLYFLPDDFNCIPVLIGDNSIQFLLSLFVQEKKLRKTRKVHTIVKITYIGRSNLFIVSLSQYHFFLGLRLNFIYTGNRTEMYYHFKKGIIFLLLSCLFFHNV